MKERIVAVYVARAFACADSCRHCAIALCAHAQTLPLMPWPVSIRTTPGSVDINAGFAMTLSGAGAADPRIKAAAQRTLVRLARQTGLPISTRADRPLASRVTMQIAVERRDHKEPQRLGDDESYSLQASGDRIQLSADGPLRRFARARDLSAARPGEPRSATGFLGSVSRYPRPTALRLARTFARRLPPLHPGGANRAHDRRSCRRQAQRFALASVGRSRFSRREQKFPRLQDYRVRTALITHKPKCAAWSLTRATVGSVSLCPNSTCPATPRVGSPVIRLWRPAIPEPYSIVHEFGDPSGAMDPNPKESTYRFLDSFIGEMAKLFPDEYFHIGGDEVSAKSWTGEPHVREFMKAHHIANAAGLQALFNTRVEKILAHHGKHGMAGW